MMPNCVPAFNRVERGRVLDIKERIVQANIMVNDNGVQSVSKPAHIGGRERIVQANIMVNDNGVKSVSKPAHIGGRITCKAKSSVKDCQVQPCP
jgi:hypothetical protein